MSWFEDREADQRWMQGKHGTRMARQLERLGREDVVDDDDDAADAKGSATAVEPLVSFFGAGGGAGGAEVPIGHDLETARNPDFGAGGKNSNKVDQELAKCLTAANIGSKKNKKAKNANKNTPANGTALWILGAHTCTMAVVAPVESSHHLNTALCDARACFFNRRLG